MIPRANVTAWRRVAPWPEDAQVEQDLVLSRAIVELFRRPAIAEQVAFRGGTALHKLFFHPPGRYSEDLDLVQRQARPIGPLIDEVRSLLDPWLGRPLTRAGHGRFTLVYRFDTTFAPVVTQRVKIELNTREHFAVWGHVTRPFAVRNPWFDGEAEVVTYRFPELLATKLRALYQRKKGRDLFDLELALAHSEFDASELVAAFEQYLQFGGTPVSRAQLEANMAGKLEDPAFGGDVAPLLRTGLAHDPAAAWARVHAALVGRLRGEPWKGNRGSP